MRRDEADEMAAKTRMALAEAGYTDPTLVGTQLEFDGEWYVQVSWLVPGEVVWRAGRILGRPMPCLACYKRAHDNTHSPCRESHLADCGANA